MDKINAFLVPAFFYNNYNKPVKCTTLQTTTHVILAPNSLSFGAIFLSLLTYKHTQILVTILGINQSINHLGIFVGP